MNEQLGSHFPAKVRGAEGFFLAGGTPDRAGGRAAAPFAQTEWAEHPLVRGILDHLHFGVAVVDPDRQVLFANRAAQQECGQGRLLRIESRHLETSEGRDSRAFVRALTAAAAGRWSLVRLKDGKES